MLPLHQRDVCWNDKTRTYNLPRIRRMLSPLSYIPILSDKQDSNLRAPHPKCGEIDLTPLLSVIVPPTRFELVTPILKVWYSSQLSYEVISSCNPMRVSRTLVFSFYQFYSFHFQFLFFGGAGQDRTADTRIFSPVLYQLSYRTI